MSRKNIRELPSGLNLPLLALLVDLSYSISIFVSRLAETENIWRGRVIAPFAPDYDFRSVYYDVIWCLLLLIRK